MQRINTATKAVDLFGSGKHGFQDGNPSLGTPATQLDAAFFNSVQEAIARVIEYAGLTLDVANHTQLLQAISELAFKNLQVLTTSGTFVVPANVTRMRVEVWGGGAGGSGGIGHAGGAGGYAQKIIDVTPGDVITVTVGAGGSGGAVYPTLGGNGGASSFGAHVSATGGLNSSIGGNGVGGDENIEGGKGMDIGGSSETFVFGGSSPRGGSGGSGNSDPGIAPGGGGGAGYAIAGSAGARGQVNVWY